jgi:hypothetical protein
LVVIFELDAKHRVVIGEHSIRKYKRGDHWDQQAAGRCCPSRQVYHRGIAPFQLNRLLSCQCRQR